MQPGSFRDSTSLRQGLAAFCTMVIAFSLGVYMLRRGIHSPIAWLPSGLAAALAVRWGRGTVPWLVAGGVLVGLLGQQPPHGLLSGALAMSVGPLLLPTLLDLAGFRRDFARRDDVLRFALATVVAMLAPALVSLLLIELNHALGATPTRMRGTWLDWWLNGTMATMLIAPPVIAAHRGLLNRWWAAGRQVLALAAATAAFSIGMISFPQALEGMWVMPLGVLIVVVSALQLEMVFTGLLVLAMTYVMAAVVDLQAPSTFMLPGPMGTAHVWAFGMVLTGVSLVTRALLAEREQLDERLREAELRHRLGLLEAASREQERIGRDVHDALGQELTAIALLARSLENRARQRAPELSEEAAEIVRTSWRATHSARAIARGLVPHIERSGDLARALQGLAMRLTPAEGPPRIHVDAGVELALPVDAARNLYRIAQEATSNALRHAQARNVWLTLAREAPADRPAIACLTIEDDGVGFEQGEADTAGLGLRTMQYRAEVSGGQIEIRSARSGGTQVRCTLPLAAARSGAAADPAPMALPTSASATGGERAA